MVPTRRGKNVRIVFPGTVAHGVNTLYLSVEEEEGGVPYLRPRFRDLVSFTTFHNCLLLCLRFIYPRIL